MTDKTAKRRWQQSPAAPHGALPLGDSHSHPDRAAARLAVLQLSAPGWNQLSISRVWHVSRPTVEREMHRFEAEALAGLVERPRGPGAPRNVWFPLMRAISHRQKAHPDAGACRLWSLWAQTTIAVRTRGRGMALNRQVDEESPPPQGALGPQQPARHTRPRRAGPTSIGASMDARGTVPWTASGGGASLAERAPPARGWPGRWPRPQPVGGTLLGWYTACLRSGAPQSLLADSGGAFTANEVTAVVKRLALPPTPLGRTHGDR
jgi:hypothetical protein